VSPRTRGNFSDSSINCSVYSRHHLLLLSVSAVILWWRRLAVGVFGAPIPASRSSFSGALAALIVAFGKFLRMLGISLIFVSLTERFVAKESGCSALAGIECGVSVPRITQPEHKRG
jgi:hypothetical protein